MGYPGNANAGGHFSRRGKVGYHRLDQQLGNAPAAVAGLLVDRRALAVFMPGKAYPPPGLPFGFDPVGPASAVDCTPKVGHPLSKVQFYG